MKSGAGDESKKGGGNGAKQSLILSTSAYDKAKAAAPRYDVYFLEQEWREWVSKMETPPQNADAAFIGFCRMKAEKNPL
jgi:hypothetical protein